VVLQLGPRRVRRESRRKCTAGLAGGQCLAPPRPIPLLIQRKRRVSGAPWLAAGRTRPPSLEIVQVAYSVHYRGNGPGGESRGLAAVVDLPLTLEMSRAHSLFSGASAPFAVRPPLSVLHCNT
jgi:hypothetical protein